MNPVYVSVDLDRERVIAIAADPAIIDPDAYILTGEHSGQDDGVIFLDAGDDSHDGRRAREIALAAGEIGLGWTFRLSDER